MSAGHPRLLLRRAGSRCLRATRPTRPTQARGPVRRIEPGLVNGPSSTPSPHTEPVSGGRTATAGAAGSRFERPGARHDGEIVAYQPSLLIAKVTGW
jgi:hypothetical protein